MISVIIPVYNEEKVIEACLISLSRQSFKDVQVIVVDDGSTDNTLKVVKVAGKPNNFQLFKQNHKGAGAARNRGARYAKGNILVFVDADMTFDKDFITKLTQPIREGKVIGTFSKHEYLSNKTNPWARSWNINRNLPPDKMIPDNYPDTQKVFRAILKKEFEKAGGFDEKAGYTDDWSLSERLGIEAVAALGAKFYHKNPETLGQVFIQSRWMAKRKYKLGALGYMIALIRVSLPVSFVFGIYKTVLFKIPEFLIFKLVSDFGEFIGILEFWILGKHAK